MTWQEQPLMLIVISISTLIHQIQALKDERTPQGSCMTQNLTPNIAPTDLTMTLLMTPDMANFSGNVHGGTILKLLDQVAYACASRYTGGYVVTLSVDQVIFKEPIYVGELVTFFALCAHQPCRQHLDGGRHSCRGRKHSDSHHTPHQQLLF